MRLMACDICLSIWGSENKSASTLASCCVCDAERQCRPVSEQERDEMLGKRASGSFWESRK